MKRREFIALVGGAAAAWPVVAHAQQGTMPVIGFLHLTSLETNRENLADFRLGLADTGYTENKNVTIEYRWAQGRNDQLPTLVAELVRQKVSVIVVLESTNGALAAKSTTQTIPVVFMQSADPVRKASSGASIDPVEISLASISCWQKRPESALSCCSNWCLRPSRSLTSEILLILFMPKPTQEKRRLRRVLMGCASSS
jgi:ABC transporter substrate binding protein